MKHSNNLTNRILLFIIFSVLITGISSCASNKDHAESNNSFLIADEKGAVPVVFDTSEPDVISISANLFASDVKSVTGQLTEVTTDLPKSERIILVGTLDKSSYIQKLIEQKKIDCQGLKELWETSRNYIVKDPFPNVKEALVIVGSDRRGAAYGLLQLSRDMGVSPWKWWADAKPQKHAKVYYVNQNKQLGPPSIKYRGIFINDEDWSLIPWASKTFDPQTANIGPKTYQKVFELMLRLRSNYIWPAMHGCSLPFNHFDENAVLADRYAIVCGSSHCEPMLRNNVREWPSDRHDDWNYFTNRDEIYKYWDDIIKKRCRYENVYTVGMRGIHDGDMPGGKDRVEKARKLEEVFKDQREILENRCKKNASDIPTIFCPYKEVLHIYDTGLKVPDDTMICWAEDNQGYVRRLPDEQERKRSGGHGIYYHLSYWSDYLWLSSIQPQLISFELTKAYEYDINKLWVFNVGDIKPAEKELEFCMDLGWDIKTWSPDNANQWPQKWAGRTFGSKFAKDIGEILNEYYRLSYRGKPEHIGHAKYPLNELHERLNDYSKIAEKAEQIRAKIPERLQTAYFHLVYYPLVACKYHNDKVLLARLSHIEAAAGNKDKSIELSKQAEDAFEKVKQLTDEYNSKSNGKWKHFMSYNPRNLKVLNEPRTAVNSKPAKFPVLPEPDKIITLNDPYKIENSMKGYNIKVAEGLSVDGPAAYMLPHDSKPIPDDLVKDAPALVFKTALKQGQNRIRVICLPTYPVSRGGKLRLALSVDSDKPEIRDFTHKERFHNYNSCTYTLNLSDDPCLNGFVYKDFTVDANEDRNSKIRVSFLDPAVVFYRLEIYSD